MLADSEHFNLVTIYTQKPLRSAFSEVTAQFSTSIAPSEFGIETLEGYISDWEDVDTEIASKLVESVSAAVYLSLIERAYWSANTVKTSDILGDFNQLWKDAPAEITARLDKKVLLNRSIRSYESTVGLVPVVSLSLVARALLDAPHKWIQVGNLFISFVEKAEDPANLLNRMLTCLTEWNPAPNRLALAKLRAELDAIGLKGDPHISEGSNIQAYWLDKLLRSQSWERKEQIGTLVDRQTELLFDRLRDKVVSYTSEVIEKFDGTRPNDVIKRFFGPSAQPKGGVIGHNTLVSNKRVSGPNLSTGHIVKFIEDGKPQFWVCVSPACDLVPHRKNVRSLRQRLEGWLPFTSVKLEEITDPEDSLKIATQGHIIFINIDGVYSQYSIYPGGDISKNPEWEEFYAGGEGVIDSTENFKIQIAQLHLIQGPSGSETGSFKLIDGNVVAQLRAEYAVNLSQRFTNHLSRVGLDYSQS